MENQSKYNEELPELLSIKQAAKIIGISETALRRRTQRGNGPPVVHPTERTRAIVRKDLEEWFSNLQRNPTRNQKRKDELE